MADQIYGSLDVFENISMKGGSSKSLDVGGGELVDFRVDTDGSLPTHGATQEARLFYNSADKILYYDNGSKWVPIKELVVGNLPTHASTHYGGGTDEIRLDQLQIPQNSINMNNKNVINLADPTGDLEAVNLRTLKTAIAGGRYKSEPVEAVQVDNVSAFPPTSLLTIDGTTATVGKSYLFTNQSNQAQNGIWVAKSAGTAWERRADFDSLSEAVSAMVVVERGTTYKDTQWMCTVDSNATGTWGSTLNLPFIQIPSLADFVAGKGITKTGNTVSVDISSTAKEDESDSLKFTSGVLGVKLLANGGLQATNGASNITGGVSVKAGTGITVDSSGVNLATNFKTQAKSTVMSAAVGTNTYTHSLGAIPQVVLFYSSTGSQVYFDVTEKTASAMKFSSPVAVSNITVVCMVIG